MAEQKIKVIKRKMIGSFMISLLDGVDSPCKYLSIMHISENALMFVWSTEKKDYWYDKDPSNAKFFRIQLKKVNDDSIQRGIYIGRLAMVIMQPKKGG